MTLLLGGQLVKYVVKINCDSRDGREEEGAILGKLVHEPVLVEGCNS